MLTTTELEALPVYEPFGRDTYDVQPDGTVTLPDGRVLRGLVGKQLHVPRMQDQIKAIPLEDCVWWKDAYNQRWATVMTEDGLKKRPA